MKSKQITPEEFQKLLPKICDKETSHDPDRWTEDNPLWGHCARVSVLVHMFFGGEIVVAKLTIPHLQIRVNHYWNILPNGKPYDFSRAQFKGRIPILGKEKRVTNNLVHLRIKRSKTFQLLALRLARVLYGNNPLFNDLIYKQCFGGALESRCQKMWFGCVVTHQSEIIYRGHNKIIKPLESMCKPTCIRFSITSRTESMLGACGHAEEWGLKCVREKNIPLKECDLYIAGFSTKGKPWIKQERSHTCLRCATQMYLAQVGAIYVPVVDKWEKLSTEEALETARLYATKEKTVESK